MPARSRPSARNLGDYLGAAGKAEWDAGRQGLVEQGVPEDIAGVVAGTPYLYSPWALSKPISPRASNLKRVAHLYHAIGERLQLDWFAQAINQLVPATHWQALARESFREDLDWQQRALTVGVLSRDTQGQKAAGQRCWSSGSANHEGLIDRWNLMLAELRNVEDPEYAMFSVALRELLDLAQTTIHIQVGGAG